MKKNEIIEVAEPDIEIVIRVGKSEVAVIGMFDAGGGTWDTVVGIDDSNNRERIYAALQIASSAVQSASFGSVRAIGDATDVPFK